MFGLWGKKDKILVGKDELDRLKADKADRLVKERAVKDEEDYERLTKDLERSHELCLDKYCMVCGDGHTKCKGAQCMQFRYGEVNYAGKHYIKGHACMVTMKDNRPLIIHESGHAPPPCIF